MPERTANDGRGGFSQVDELFDSGRVCLHRLTLNALGAASNLGQQLELPNAAQVRWRPLIRPQPLHSVVGIEVKAELFVCCPVGRALQDV